MDTASYFNPKRWKMIGIGLTAVSPAVLALNAVCATMRMGARGPDLGPTAAVNRQVRT